MTPNEKEITYIKGFTSYTDYLRSATVNRYLEENGIELPDRCIEVRDSDGIKTVEASEEIKKEETADRKNTVKRANGIAVVTLILGLLTVASIIVLCFVKGSGIEGANFGEKLLNMLSGSSGIMNMVAIIFAIIAIIVIIADIIMLIVINKAVKENEGA